MRENELGATEKVTEKCWSGKKDGQGACRVKGMWTNWLSNSGDKLKKHHKKRQRQSYTSKNAKARTADITPWLK